jgi:transketolase
MNKCLTKETAFPIEVLTFVPLHLSENLTESVQAQLQKNINLMRNAIVFITAYSKVRGLGGHTGGAYDIVPELIILDALRRGGADIHGVFYDDAGHRVAAHYVLAALTPEHDLGADALLRYREYAGGLPGHPERAEEAPGFSSGRLGHIWPYANGIAMAENKRIIVFSSDGAQQEGNNAEAARFAVAHQLPVTVIIDDNDVTIAGKTSEYLPGFDLKKTLEGFGISTFTCNGEDLKELFATIKKALDVRGPSAVVCKRKIAPGIKGLEGSNKAHDAIPVDIAIEYLGQNQQEAAVALLEQTTKQEKTSALLGSSSEKMKNRSEFGKILCDIIDTLPEKERSQLIRVFDSDLAGSCGLLYVKERHPELFVSGGIMERHNFSAAAGFGSEYGRQGVFATFAVFLEMLVSELSMARLNHANVLVHLSHSGVDEISDNTTHFGLNNFFADNGLDDDTTRLYFPADGHQLRALMMRIFDDPGVRFVFRTEVHSLLS